MFHLHELLMFFLRPPKDKYEEEFLGPNFLHLYDKNYYRKDLKIKNRRGEVLKCCYFVPFSCNENTPCVVYAHSVNSCQLEVLDILHILIICECSVFSFDCAGCGLSEGLYSTLGWNEAQDLFLVLNHLRNVEKVKNIALWGKYSGAASSIIVAALDQNIKLLILDSPFVSLIELYRTMFCLNVKKQREIFFKNLYLQFARKKIKKHFRYDINNVSPIFFIDKITIPTIYIISKNDKLVHPIHTFYLADKQKNSHKLVIVSDKQNSSPDVHSNENTLISAIKTVLYDLVLKQELNNIFNPYTYSKLFTEYKNNYLVEFNIIDKHIKKNMKQKKKVINNAEKFIYFKYRTQNSITSSCCLNQSTMDSMGDLFLNENESMNYQRVQSKHFENHKKEKFPVEQRVRSQTSHAFPDIEKLVKESLQAGYLLEEDSKTFNKLNEPLQPNNNENNLYKLMHMQSARSSLKTTAQRKYKKSLTWDSNLHRSVSYFIEDCPHELLKMIN